MGHPDALVVRGAPDAHVRGDGDAQLAGDLEGGALGEGRVAGDVEGHLEGEHVVGRVDLPPRERLEVRRGRPLPRALLDVAVGEDEPAGHRPQRVDRGLGVAGGLQAVRPVDARGHAGVDRLQRGEQVPRVHVLGPEVLARLEVVPDEVLGERPVGAVAAHRGLPHVPVRVDHAGHDDAARGVDLPRALGHLQGRPDLGDPVAGHQHVGVGQHAVRGVDGEHRAAAQDDRPPDGRGHRRPPVARSAGLRAAPAVLMPRNNVNDRRRAWHRA